MNLRAGMTVKPKSAMRLAIRWMFVGAGAILALGEVPAQAGDSVWSGGTGGSWANPANWGTGAVADGTDSMAYFGFSFEAAIPSIATFTLDAARTIGNLYFIPQNAPVNWVLSPGSGGSITLDTTFNTPDIFVDSPEVQVTINAVLAGNKGLNKSGPGTLILTANNTYSGDTIVSGGKLQVSGQIGAGKVAVQGGELTCTGTIGGPMAVQSGGTLSLGGAIGNLSINNSLTLDSGSTTFINVNAATLGHDFVDGLTSVNYAGTLAIRNLGGTLAAGQSFHIFSAAAASGNFSSIIPAPGAGLAWQFDPASGVLSVVVRPVSQPWIAGMAMNGGNLIMRVTNGLAGATGYVLCSTNMALPLTDWTRVATDIFDANGNLRFTNPVTSEPSQQYFLISVPQVP